MKIDSSSNSTGLQHIAARAQEARKPAEPKPVSSAATETPPTGKNLPPATAAVQPEQKPDHATGLDRAIERLQANTLKSPEASGLQHALEKLQSKQESGGAVDTQV